jgi:fibronectin type 3 domain-containing protein
VQRSTNSGGPYTTVGSPTNNSFVDTGVTAATTYYYVVEAVGSSGTSAPSAPVSGLTMPTTPTGVTATGVSGSEIDLSWTAVTGATSYSILRSPVTGGPYAADGTSSTPSFADTGLASNTSYFYVVEAVDASGASGPSFEASATTLLGPPSGLSATATSASQINVSWSQVTGATDYTVQRATAPGGPFTVLGNTGGPTSFQDIVLSPGTTYYYEVQSVNDAGSSAFSAAVSALTYPAAPSGVTATPVSTTEIDLSWTAVKSATSYKVQRAVSSGGPFTTIGTTTSPSFASTGLIAGKTYYYLIQAINPSGSSASSSVVSATTP